MMGEAVLFRFSLGGSMQNPESNNCGRGAGRGEASAKQTKIQMSMCYLALRFFPLDYSQVPPIMSQWISLLPLRSALFFLLVHPQAEDF